MTAPNPPVVEDQSETFALLADARTHGRTASVSRIDTHGAVVFLAGASAYKVKRAVRYPFMDFSTLAKRRAACEAEIAVNAPNAPDIYLGVIPITRITGTLSLGGAGEIIEWAVHMRRFDETQTLDHVAGRGELTPDLCAQLARAVHASHLRAPRRDGRPATRALADYIAQNAAAFQEAPELFPPAAAGSLNALTRGLFSELEPLLLKRGSEGFVQRCHGDLHLRNLVLLDGKPTLFDAVEFDEAIATGDVLYDLAFLLMDLWERGLRSEANLVLNRYLRESADDRQLTGLSTLPLFTSLRAAIRAKVTAAALPHLSGEPRDHALREARRYFDAAAAFLAPAPPRLIAVGGYSGTGKSTLASKLAASIGRAPGAVHLRTDTERKRLLNVAELERLPPGGYKPAVTEQVYARLRRMAKNTLEAGQGVIVDAVHGRPEQREALADVAREVGVPFAGLWLTAPTGILVQRVEARTGDASDATADVITQQADAGVEPENWAQIDASRTIPTMLQHAQAAIARATHRRVDDASDES